MKKHLKDKFPKEPATYVIKDPITETFYIGATGNLSNRLAAHRCELSKGEHSNPNLQEIYNTNHNLEVEYEIKSNKEEALEAEQTLLDSNFSNELNLNRSSLSYGLTGDMISEEVKEASRKRMLGNNLGSGRVMPDEHKAKLKEINTGNKYGVGRKLSEQEIENLRQCNLGNKRALGHKHSDESKKKISEAMKGRSFSDSHKEKLSEKKSFPVIVDGVEYRNGTEAAKANNVSKRTAHHRFGSKSFPNWIKK